MRYAQARYQSTQREMAYRIFLTDGIRMIGESVAKQFGGTVMAKRFYDIIKPKKIDTRSGNEIAADVLERMGVRII